jgi:hypothetical protein
MGGNKRAGAQPRRGQRTPQVRQKVVLGLEVLEARDCPSNFTVIASGLEGPRGLTFAPGGGLYVAEAGLGGTSPSTGQQVPPPVGPYTGGPTARISRIDPAHNNTRTTVAAGLPSAKNSLGDFSGVADVTFFQGTLYSLETGGGPSHGNPNTLNGIYRINPDGTFQLVADLSAFERTHPVQNPDPSDFELDGNFYSMVQVGGALYVTAPNHQEILRVNPTDGTVSRVIDLSVFFNPAKHNWAGPTGLAFQDGLFYVGTLGEFPIHPGTQSALKIKPNGLLGPGVSGLTAVVAVAFHDGQLYALETSTAAGFPTAGTGKVVRVTAAGTVEDVATGLSFPTAMAFGPDGALFVSNDGYGAPTGEVVRIGLPAPFTYNATSARFGQIIVGPVTTSNGVTYLNRTVPFASLAANGTNWNFENVQPVVTLSRKPNDPPDNFGNYANRNLLLSAQQRGAPPTTVLIPPLTTAQAMLSTNNVLGGVDNVFVNAGRGDPIETNIERADFVFPQGEPTSARLAVAVFDLGVFNQHDPFQIAPILSVDAAGNPTSYGPPLSIPIGWGQPNLYPGGGPGNSLPYQVLSDNHGTLAPILTVNGQVVGGVLIPLSDFSVTTRTIYGYSLFAPDVNPGSDPNNLVNWTNPAVYPENTPNSVGGIDLIAGSGRLVGQG